MCIVVKRGEKPKSIEENYASLRLTWPGNEKHNCKVKKNESCLLHQLVTWHNCNKHLESL